MKRKPVVFVVLFFVILSLLAGLTFGLPAKEFSANENRYLAQMPAFSVDALLSGEFQSQLDTFLSDQIPLREFWIETNTNIKKWLGKTEINGVYFGSDGYYFQQFTESSYSASRKDAVFALLERFAGKQTASVTVMPVPTPGAVLNDKLPANAPMYDADAMWEDLKTSVPSAGFVDLRETFHNAKEQLYYKTDHHWTAYGAYEAYVRYCASTGLTAKPLDHFNLEQVSDSFYGTIYSKTLDSAAKPDSIYAPRNLPQISVTFDGEKTGNSVYDESFLSQKDQYAYFFGGNWGKVEINTGANNGKRLLVIKDSFANSFVPYLLEDYEQIIMLDLRYFGGNTEQVIADSGITDVLVLYEMTNLLTDTGIIKLTK